MAEEIDPHDDEAALRARLATLTNAIRTHRPPEDAPQADTARQTNDSGSQMSMGLRAGSEFVAAILVGGAIGWGLDWVFHSKPLFTILFFLLGAVAGVINVIRATSPKGGNFVADSRLSGESVEDKDVPRGEPR
jgi:ATP synthase protein I